MHGEIDHHADIGHARRERTDAGDRDGENVLALERLLDGLHRRIEALDMADHQRDAGRARRGDDLAPLLDIRGDRLFHQHVNAARDAFERQFVMQVGGRGDGDRIEPRPEQIVDMIDRGSAENAGDQFALLRARIGDADQFHIGQGCKDARMIGAHDPGADNADAHRAASAMLDCFNHNAHTPRRPHRFRSVAWPPTAGDCGTEGCPDTN